jgi:serine/threonine protein kinase
MHYLHNSGTPVLHRDLKSLNLLLADPVRGPNDPVNIKITDFGISRVLDTESLS